MDAAELPPAAEKVFARRTVEFLAKFLESVVILQVALNLLLQRLRHAWHCNQHGNALALDRVHDLSGFERVLKENRSAKEGGQVHSQKLPEHVAERKQIQKTDGMHQTLI